MEILHAIPEFEATGLVKAGISLRQGGISRSSYTSFNLASHVGDEPRAVARNRQIFLRRTGLTSLFYCYQIHGNCVVDVDRESVASEKSCVLPRDVPGDSRLPLGRFTANVTSGKIRVGDSLITARPGVGIGVFTADCVPVFIFDTVTPAIGIVHAGWRGTLAGIARNALMSMKSRFGTAMSNCLIHLGPSIQKCCYRVSPELLFEFEKHFGKIVRTATHLSLQAVNALQLAESGVLSSSISVSPFCTACCTETFYSHRASGGQTGRMLSYIVLPLENV